MLRNVAVRNIAWLHGDVEPIVISNEFANIQ